MDTKLFTNVVRLESSVDWAKKILSNPQYLLKWVPEVTTVDKSDGTFMVKRNGNALNQTELIHVEEDDSKVIYVSSGGKLEYRLEFSISAEDKKTVVQEDLYIPENVDTRIPVKLLAPIAEHAFSVNLDNLAVLIEKIANQNDVIN